MILLKDPTHNDHPQKIILSTIRRGAELPVLREPPRAPPVDDADLEQAFQRTVNGAIAPSAAAAATNVTAPVNPREHDIIQLQVAVRKDCLKIPGHSQSRSFKREEKDFGR